MNDSDSLQEKQKIHLIVMTYMQKLLFVICVYVAFGQLFQHVYAAVDTGNPTDDEIASDPYQSQHGPVWLLPEND